MLRRFMNPIISWEIFKALLERKRFLLWKLEFEVKLLAKRKAKDIEGYQ